MKKLLCVFLAMVLLAAMVVPVAADNGVVTVSIGKTMTEQEFRTQAQAATVFRFSQTRSFNSDGLQDQGYYYANLLKQPDNTALLGYTIASSGYSWDLAASLDRKAWVSNEHISLEPMLGTVYGSYEFSEKWDDYAQKILAGIWAYRYDAPSVFERYTITTNVDVKISLNSVTREITAFDVYAVMEDHPDYQEDLLVARDQTVKQIAAKANQKGSQLEALRYIHNYLILNAEYDYRQQALNNAYSNTDIFYYAHASFGVLNKGLGVCESYAKAFKLICDSLDNGPECVLVTSSNHMWNVVRLDGKWYCRDATWDDGGGDQVRDTYFLCGDPDVVDGDSTDHVPLTNYGPAPEYAQEAYQPCVHKLNFVPKTDATETTTGVKAHYRCGQCGQLFEDQNGTKETKLAALTIAKLPHTHLLAFVPQIDATQINTGVKAHYKCEGCGKLFVDAQGKSETTQKALTIAKLPVPLSAPVIAVANTTNGVKISWTTVGRAEKYYVYRRTSTTAAWKRIKATTAVGFVDTTVTSGSAYQYLVRAVAGTEMSAYSNIVAVRFLASTKPVAKNAAAGITASWSKVPGATGYIVYRRQKTASGWSAWKKLATTKALTYTDKTAAAGKDYIYGAVAYSGSYKAVCAAGDAVRRLVVASVKTTTEGNYLKTTWGKASGATSYIVYRSQLSGKTWSSWSKVATTTKNTFTDKKVKSGVTYKYRVFACDSASKSAYAEGSSVKLLTTPKVTVKAYTKSIVAKWGKVTGATGYTVYRRQKTASGWSAWKKLANTKALSYTDQKAKNGVQYQYTVVAYSGSAKSNMAASAAVCILSTPKVTLANYKSGIKLSWKKITGAEKYVVYRSQLNGKKWSGYKNIATTNSIAYVDKTAKSKVSYKYYVVAASGSSQSSYKATSALKYTAKK